MALMNSNEKLIDSEAYSQKGDSMTAPEKAQECLLLADSGRLTSLPIADNSTLGIAAGPETGSRQTQHVRDQFTPTC